ncbi:MAG: Hsp20/alpha crystallin family protein [Candidatus Pacebacteria bacterium]|nr:Hsp20/alpha crystallin family protein [Candidatus Paceibacterota bacterium]
MIKKPSFFSKITGSADADYDDFYTDQPAEKPAGFDEKSARHLQFNKGDADDSHQEDPGGELAVDVYQTADAIVVKALIAGVQPSTIDIALTREMLTISGSRTDDKEVEEDGYYQRELYWGSFTRTILLPEEVDVDMAEASEKHGVLMIRLPKINKKRQTRLKVRAR